MDALTAGNLLSYSAQIALLTLAAGIMLALLRVQSPRSGTRAGRPFSSPA